MDNFVNYYTSDELYHYGVKGMKWGIRRYQDEHGALTPAGKKRAKQEVKKDNKTAYELGKAATVYGHAAAKSMKRTIKIENKLDKHYAKDPSGTSRRAQSLRKKWDASSKTTLELGMKYRKLQDAAEEHCKSLIKKYGKEAVSEIKYTDKKLPKGEYSPSSFKTMNEKTNNMSDYASAGVMSLATTAMTTMMGMPIAMVYTPKSTGRKASDLEMISYQENRRAQHK